MLFLTDAPALFNTLVFMFAGIRTVPERCSSESVNIYFRNGGVSVVSPESWFKLAAEATAGRRHAHVTALVRSFAAV